MEVEPEHAEVPDSMPGFADRVLTLEGIDRSPRLNNPAGVALLHARDEVVRTWRRVNRRFQIERHQDGFDSGISEILHHFGFGFGDPFPFPVFGQSVHVRLLTRNPFLCIRITVNVDHSHKTLRRYRVCVRAPGFVGHGFRRAVKGLKIKAALAAGALGCEFSHRLYRP